MTHLQGNFDGLCGIYSTINAFNQMFRMDGEVKKGLFKTIIKHLGEKKTYDIILNGCNTFRLKKYIIASAVEYIENLSNVKITIDHKLAKSANDIASLKKILFQNFSNQENPCAVILGYNNEQIGENHWTCCIDVSDKRLKLSDSVYRKHIEWSKCSTAKSTALKPFFIDEVILISFIRK